jgi:hypothetical protein
MYDSTLSTFPLCNGQVTVASSIAGPILTVEVVREMCGDNQRDNYVKCSLADIPKNVTVQEQAFNLVSVVQFKPPTATDQGKQYFCKSVTKNMPLSLKLGLVE